MTPPLLSVSENSLVAPRPVSAMHQMLETVPGSPPARSRMGACRLRMGLLSSQPLPAGLVKLASLWNISYAEKHLDLIRQG